MALHAVALLGCSDLFAPFLPDGRVPLAPLPPEYETWWSLIESCSGLQGELHDVEWWVLAGGETFPDGDGGGRYYELGHQIGLTDGVVREGFLVRHEMLHALLSANRIDAEHPKAFFESRCGGIVSCSGDCLDEVGGPPAEASEAPLVAPEDIEVTVQVLPPVMKQAPSEEGCVTIVVGATHTGDASAVMDLSHPRPFGWIVEGWGGGRGGGPIPPNDTVLLRAGATRYQAYDCPRPFRHFEPGEYLVRGEWERVRSAGVNLTIIP